MDSSEKVHEVRATILTTRAGFLDTTAIALCRAALHDFPNKMVERTYSIELNEPDAERMRMLILKNCHDAPTEDVWYQGKEWCTRDNGQTCLFEKSTQDLTGTDCHN